HGGPPEGRHGGGGGGEGGAGLRDVGGEGGDDSRAGGAGAEGKYARAGPADLRPIGSDIGGDERRQQLQSGPALPRTIAGADGGALGDLRPALDARGQGGR